MSQSSSNPTIDKEGLYGTFLKSHERMDQLEEDAIRKSLDLPGHEKVNITTHQHSGGWKSVLLGAALLATGGVGALGLASLAGFGTKAVPQEPSQEPSQEPLESQEYKVEFFRGDQPIEVERERERERTGR